MRTCVVGRVYCRNPCFTNRLTYLFRDYSQRIMILTHSSRGSAVVLIPTLRYHWAGRWLARGDNIKKSSRRETWHLARPGISRDLPPVHCQFMRERNQTRVLVSFETIRPARPGVGNWVSTITQRLRVNHSHGSANEGPASYVMTTEMAATAIIVTQPSALWGKRSIKHEKVHISF